MLAIDWVEIPEGECTVGISDEQRKDLRTRLWREYGLGQLDAPTQRVLNNLRAKYQRAAREAGYSLNDDLTPEEQRLKPNYDDPRAWYFLADAELERIPPQRRLWLPTFYIARFPITHGQADVFFTSENARWRELERIRIRPDSDALPEMPEQFYWPAADVMAHRLGGRLPTVIEWEKAARGDDGRLYPWGNTWEPSCGNFGPEHRPTYSRQHGLWRTVVNTYPRGVSPYGVWDMAGNLSEWTMTRIASDTKSAHEVPLVKGEEAKNLGLPKWFWSIVARQHPGSRYSGFRPVLSRWQRQVWLGADIPSVEEEQ